MSESEATSQSIDGALDKSNVNQMKLVVDVFKGLGKVLNDVGIAGFIVISIVFFLYFFTDKYHKDAIVDAWFLFKSGNSQPFIIIFVLVILLFAQQIHYKRVIKMKQERINELSNKKSSSYSKQLEMKLASSNKNKKS